MWWARPYRNWWQSTREGAWERDLPADELGAWRVGLVGLGQIGQTVADLLETFSVRVIAFDPHRSLDRTRLEVAPTLRDLAQTVDVLSLHVPLADDTRHLIGDAELDALDRQAYLINSARGGIVDEAALLRHLERGRLGGVWLDVRESEPPPQPDRLAQFERVLLTPHIAGLTRTANAAVGMHVAQEVARHLSAPPARD